MAQGISCGNYLYLPVKTEELAIPHLHTMQKLAKLTVLRNAVKSQESDGDLQGWIKIVLSVMKQINMPTNLSNLMKNSSEDILLMIKSTPDLWL